MDKEIYYRPEWTCGKYNATKHVAIMFNLLENSEYFFEDESADVVGIILKAGRNGIVSVSQTSSLLDISPESLEPFFITLLGIGLLSKKCPSFNDIQTYRKQCASQKTETEYYGDKVDAISKCDISTVEQVYGDAVADCSEITNAVFELTYRCSEKCLHCYNIGAIRNDEEKSGRGDFAELSFSEYKTIIDDMCDAGLVTATLTGGDPFANKDVWDIWEYLYQKDIAVTVQTNGQQLVNQIERLSNLYPRCVRLSLYAADPKAHDGITRKKGSWQTTINVIKELRANGVPVGINCVLMRPGLKSYLELKKIGEDLSSPVLFDCGVIDSLEGDLCATHHLRLTPEELEIVMMDEDIEAKKDDFEMYSNPAPYEHGAPCLAGKGTFCVMPDGKLIPCVSMHMVLGDLKTENFHSIVSDNEILQRLIEGKASDYIECGTHNYCKCCSFCAGNSYSKHGTPFKANENNCYIAKCKYSLMEKLKAGDDVLNGKTIQESIEALPEYVFPVMHIEYEKGR